MSDPNSLTDVVKPETTPQDDGDAPDASTELAQPKSPDASPVEKKKPYVNPERVKTGGAQRDKLTDDELAERMARIREQNEKIKQRRLDVQADEDAFKKTQQAEQARIAHNRKVQANVDRTREQNAQRKMDKIQNREWDSGKPTSDWKSKKPTAVKAPATTTVVLVPADASAVPPETTEAPKTDVEPSVARATPERGGRDGSRGRGTRGRGRGRGQAHSTPSTPVDEKSVPKPEPKPEPVAAAAVTATKE
ncbi:hypothetical protein HGRIS_013366 [Hohenbuehelia grisea]|uniref:Uncharacterized protein n=1 Tax=Hohenbuehelia grisea TaxID=104357 RepID=A0ABR3IVA8_9AGAR